MAHLRKLFPQLVYGAISSSGVVASVRNNYGYYHQIARGNNATAIQGLQAAIRAMDKIVAPEPWRGSKQTNIDQKKFAKLLELFNLKGIKNPLSLGFLATSALGWVSGRLNRPSSVTADLLAHLSTKETRGMSLTPHNLSSTSST